MHGLEGDLELLDRLVQFSHNGDHSGTFEAWVTDALEAGEDWILQFPAK